VSVSTSDLVQDHAQLDGRRRTLELHTDHLGVAHQTHGLIATGDDASALMVSHASALESSLAEAERKTNVQKIRRGRPILSLTFDHSSVGVFRSRLRDLYAKAVGLEAAYISRYFNSLTNPTLRTVFDYTNAQVNTMRTSRFDPHIALIASVEGAAGK